MRNRKKKNFRKKYNKQMQSPLEQTYHRWIKEPISKILTKSEEATKSIKSLVEKAGKTKIMEKGKKSIQETTHTNVMDKFGSKLQGMQGSMQKKGIAALFALVILAGAGVFGYWLYEGSLVYKTCSVEAGVTVSVGDFLKKEDAKAYFTDKSDTIDVTVPNEYHVSIKKGLFTYASVLKISDTIAPEVEAQDVKIELGETCQPEDFIKNVQDATVTQITFVKEPDYSNTKLQTVEVAVTDAGNNTTVVQAELSTRNIVKALDWEVGSKAPEVSNFLLTDVDASIVTDLSEVDFDKVASHTIEVESEEEVYEVQLNIVDTVAPEMKVKNIKCSTKCVKTAEAFVSECNDATDVTFSFETEPDMSAVGTQTVMIVAEDEGGNKTSQKAELTLVEDTEKPVIEGAADMTVYIGENVSYKSNVKVSDVCPDVSLKVDSSQVNLKAAGSYPLTYTATDCAGNTNSITVTVTVKQRSYSLEEVNQLADQILAKILTDGMSQYDKAYAIFKYVKGNISYVNDSEKGNYLKAAYQGMVTKSGDCYTYASTAKVLLTRAGITNMDIERIPSGTSMHYWNLVDIGDGHGWYHFDTTPRYNHPVIFLWTEAQLKEYSDNNKNSHNYDRSAYPVVY